MQRRLSPIIASSQNRAPIRKTALTGAPRLFARFQSSVHTYSSNGVELRDEYLRLNSAEGEEENKTHDFHYLWLRHNCNCSPHCRHHLTGERLIDSSEIPDNIKPLSAKIDSKKGGKLLVEWSDKHHSEYDPTWLATHSYSVDRQQVEPPSDDVSKIEIDFSEKDKHDLSEYYGDVAKRLNDYGVVLVRKRGMDTEAALQDFLPEGSDVYHTHFGRIEDLRTDNTTNKNTDQLGYTDAAVNLHTDQPFIPSPPGLQMLHCIRAADVGGENQMVDAVQAAKYLRAMDKQAFKVLSTVPVHFHRKQKAFESLQVTPIIEMDGERVKQVRYSYFTMAPHNRPFEDMQEWYRAYARFARIVRDPRHQYRFLLQPGDFVLYDNYRMLHARSSFQGARHLRGVYFDHHNVWKKLGMGEHRL